MGVLLSTIVFFLILSVLVLIHELGHFVMAKRAGIKVEEFGIGFPPRIWSKKKGETVYTINAIPFGGFVKMLGEDATDPKVLKNPRSFASKSLWQRTKVIVAGVVMNFLLAFVLLVIGFSFGIEPLLVNSDDFLNGIRSGVVEINEGVRVKVVSDESLGLEAEDKIVSLNGETVRESKLTALLMKGESEEEVSVNMGVVRGDQLVEVPVTLSQEKLGMELYPFTYMPRVSVHEVEPDSLSYKAGLRAGDVIVRMNDAQIFSVKEYQENLLASPVVKYEVVRNNSRKTFDVSFESNPQVVLSMVLPESNAEKAGLRKGDQLVSIDGKVVTELEAVGGVIQEAKGKELALKINRGGEILDLPVTVGEEGVIGIMMARIISHRQQDLSVYNTDVPTSIMKINTVQYPVHEAVGQSVSEMGRLSVLTGEMFVKVVRSITSQFVVPEGVSGPVGIARLTHVFVQEGVMSVLRFVALLSLSLGVINILPFPALDGGRLLFIIVELFRGKRLDPQWEAAIHGFGFLLLMILIVVVTYSDVVKLIFS